MLSQQGNLSSVLARILRTVDWSIHRFKATCLIGNRRAIAEVVAVRATPCGFARCHDLFCRGLKIVISHAHAPGTWCILFARLQKTAIARD